MTVSSPGDAQVPIDEAQILPVLRKIWQEVLEREDVGTDQNFFEIGGQSLSLLICASKIAEALRTQIDPMDLLRYQTLGELSAYLAASKRAAAGQGTTIETI